MSDVVVRTRHAVRIATYPPGAGLGPRVLDDHELLWVLTGSARRTWTERDRGPRTSSLPPGWLGLAQPAVDDAYDWDEDIVTTHAYIHFDVVDPGGLPDPQRWPTRLDLARAPVLTGLTRYLLDLGSEPGGTARRRTDQCLQLVLGIMINGPHGDAADPGRLAPMIEYIALRWADGGVTAIGVDELAVAMRLSRGHLSALLRRRHGCGPARLVELVRLARAAIALHRDAAGVAQVAAEVGYPDPYHFSRRFSATYGLPPARFRSTPGADPLAPLRRHDLVPVARRLLTAVNPG